jgi:hypothetical protein
MASSNRKTLSVATFCALLLGAAAAYGQQFSDWSPRVNLGAAVNSPFGEAFADISRDGLSLYFMSSRPGGCGGQDIYVCRRASMDDAWGPAENLARTGDNALDCFGPVNTPSNDVAPHLSIDGHRLYFASDRPGGAGGADIYVSRRHNKRDDFGWQAAENLGVGVNTAANETGPVIFEDETTGLITLYFDSNRVGGPGPVAVDAVFNGNDIYASALRWDESFGPAALVEELSTPFIDRKLTIRRDGLELFLTSNRPGTLGFLDLWVSTRATTSDPWSVPVNIGASMNGPANDAGAALAFDGTALYFNSAPPSGSGPFDLYVTTRTKIQEPNQNEN